MTFFESPPMSDWQRQIVIGTILGGSSLVKPSRGRNCYLFMRSLNRNWLMYKAEELKYFSPQRPFTTEGNTMRWHSNCYPVFNEFRELLYLNNKKTISTKILDECCLKDIGLAIWFGDSGKIIDNRVWLNTHKFGKEGTYSACEWFNSAMIEAEVLMERTSYRVVLTEYGSQRFLATIAHRLPEFMIKD